MVHISERQKQSIKRKEICIMRKNNLFKKAIAVITAVCTLVSATGFNGVTSKAVSITTISVDQEVSGSIKADDGSEGNDYYSFVTDNTITNDNLITLGYLIEQMYTEKWKGLYKTIKPQFNVN